MPTLRMTEAARGVVRSPFHSEGDIAFSYRWQGTSGIDPNLDAGDLSLLYPVPSLGYATAGEAGLVMTSSPMDVHITPTLTTDIGIYTKAGVLVTRFLGASTVFQQAGLTYTILGPNNTLIWDGRDLGVPLFFGILVVTGPATPAPGFVAMTQEGRIVVGKAPIDGGPSTTSPL